MQSTQRTRAVPLIAVALIAIVALFALRATPAFAVEPAVTSISPESGPLAGGNLVTVMGSGFQDDEPITGVEVGGTAATFIIVDDDEITVAMPAKAAGTYDIILTNADGDSPNTSADDYTYVVMPDVESVTPSTGPSEGGTIVTITGTGFTDATEVHFGLTEATVFTVEDDTEITVTSPARSPGTVNVRVTTAGGQSATGSDANYTYTAAPAVTGVDPSGGPIAGGNTVTITGSGFTGATIVTFGDESVVPTVVDDTEITVTAPANSVGTVDVRVTTALGTSPNTTADNYTYAVGPTVSGLSPSTGPAAGGTLVTISGTGFTGTVLVDFGGTMVTPTVLSSTTLTVISPAHAAGVVSVLVTTSNGTSPDTSADDFTYAAASTVNVTSLSPANGPVAGGTVVTITGTGFTGTVLVNFGGTTVTPTVVNSTTLTVTSPAHAAGVVDVLVTTSAGTSPNTTADDFTYGVLPVITSINPANGPTAGGTTVTITGSGFTGATAVMFGAISVTPTVVNDTTITVIAPAQANGVVDVSVVTPVGTSANTAADNFTYGTGSTTTFTLFFRWTLIVWNGIDGAGVAASLQNLESPDNPSTNNVSGIITAIFRYNNAEQKFEGFFPGSEGIPGANDFSTFDEGEAYWIAKSSQGTSTWTVLAD